MNGEPPTVALFCATFLRPEMLHIHRHVTGLKEFQPLVLTQKHEGDWPAPRVELVKRSPFRFLARAREKRTGHPWQISSGEVRRFRDLLQDAKLLHVFFGNVAIHLLPLLRHSPIPVVVSFHGSDVAGSMASPAYAAAVKELFQLAAVVPCRSGQLAARVAQLGCPPTKLRIMRTILPDIRFQLRQLPADGAWRIVQAARLVPKKGLFTALQAFSRFAERYPKATFTIAGEGPLYDDLRQRAIQLGISHQVHLTGFLPQIALKVLYETSHIFLHPSEIANGDVEGIPNAMLEAMATGLPVVATHHGGIPEIVEDGANGLLCAERDAPALAEALFRLAEDHPLYFRLSEKASSSVRDQFSAERQIAAIEEIYREAILAHSVS